MEEVMCRVKVTMMITMLIMKVISDFKPEIARKINKTVHHLSSDSESQRAKQQDRDDKVTSTCMQMRGTVTSQEQDTIPKLKFILEEIHE
jgi:hypothetical protein